VIANNIEIMKYLKIISFSIAILISFSKLSAQEKPSLFLGGNINTFDSSSDKSEFLQSDFGFNLGYFTPLWKNERFNIGLNVFGQYGSVNDGFDNLKNRFDVQPQENTNSETSSNKVNQSLFQFGIGPQFNYRIGNKFWISPILKGGYFNFNQDELILIQNIEFTAPGVSQSFESDVLTQDEVSEGGLFLKPAIRLSFELTNQLSLWGEANYFVAQVNTIQNRLIPLGEPDEHGAYFIDQIVGSQDFSTVENEQELNGFGFSFGVAYSFGTSIPKAQDYNAARSNKPSSIAADPDGADKDSLRTAQDYNAARSNKPSSIAADPDGKWEPNILCGDTDHFIHVGDCDDSDRQRTPDQLKVINIRLHQGASLEKSQDNPLAEDNGEWAEPALDEGEMNGGNDGPDTTDAPLIEQQLTRNESPYSIRQVQNGVYIIFNNLGVFSKRNKLADPVNSKGDAQTNAVDQQVKISNPYFKENANTGEMELESNGAGNTENPMFTTNESSGEMVFSEAMSNGVNKIEFKRLLALDADIDIEAYKYLFFKNGIAYRIDFNPEKLEQLFDQTITKGSVNKAVPCPPTSNPEAQCKLIDGFCFCRM
jgi:hypothetical protein